MKLTKIFILYGLLSKGPQLILMTLFELHHSKLLKAGLALVRDENPFLVKSSNKPPNSLKFNKNRLSKMLHVVLRGENHAC
jgi:hypothetical protein